MFTYIADSLILWFKKGSRNKIENYRPIANLCSASKILEKLILNQIHYLENTNKLHLTGKHQHGFKRNKSTATAGALLQSIISRAADDKCYVNISIRREITATYTFWCWCWLVITWFTKNTVTYYLNTEERKHTK